MNEIRNIEPGKEQRNEIPRAVALFATALLWACLAVSAYAGYRIYGSIQLIGLSNQVLLFGSLLLVFDALVIVALRRSESFRANLATVVVSIGISVVAIEAYLDFFAAPDHLAGLPDSFDRRSVAEVVTDLRKKGVDAYPATFPANFSLTGNPVSIDGKKVIPLGAASNTNMVYCNESGTRLVYRTDEHGFNNPPGQWDKPADIVMIGDSFTEGACVPPEMNMAARFRKQFPNTLNLGKGGNDATFALATVQEIVPKLKPKIVLWFFFVPNDVEDIALNLERQPIMQRYLENPEYRQGVLGMQNKIDAAIHERIRQVASGLEADQFAKKFQNFKVLYSIRDRVAKALGWRSRFNSSDPANYRKSLETLPVIARRIKTIVERSGGHLIAIDLPDNETVTGIWDMTPLRRAAIEAISGAGVPVLDMMAEFRKNPDPAQYFYFRRFSHYTPEGYRLVADAVSKAISERKLLPQ
jgi:hypothetical protein